MTQRSTNKARASKPSKSAPAPANEDKSGAPFLAPFARSGDFDSAPAAEPTAAAIRLQIRKNLLARPDFPRLYADVVISTAPNSNEAKILAANYQKIIEATNMPVRTSVKTCTHIKVTGMRCGSPALRGEQFCYFHQRMMRGVRTPPQSRLHPIAIIEDEESIQAALMEVINALMRNSIDLKRAALILRALHIAVKNAQRARLHHSRSEAVTEVPDYAAPTEPQPKTEFDFPATAAPVQTEEEKNQQEAADFKARVQAGEKALAEMAPQAKQMLSEILNKKPAHVGTAAPGCPGGPEVSGRSEVATSPAPTMKKPPGNVKAPAPKERKNAAHGASRGTG